MNDALIRPLKELIGQNGTPRLAEGLEDEEQPWLAAEVRIPVLSLLAALTAC